MKVAIMDSNTLYKNVYTTDEHDHEEALSTTEVDESLMGDEKPSQHRKISTRQSCIGKLRSYRWILDTTLLMIILGLLLLLRHEWSQQKIPPASWQVGGD